MSQQELFDAGSLAARLRALGLEGVRRIELHDNRTVMVSVTPRRVLRVHRGFAYAPDAVLQAIVRFIRPGIRRSTRSECRRAIVSFPVHQFTPAGTRPRRRRRRPVVPAEDRGLVRELERRHGAFNERFFGGELAGITFRISRRMQSRLGEVLLDEVTGRPAEIAISRQHIIRDGWGEVDHTLLHEMIHQWQAETGQSVDHGGIFRRKAREVGITPRATRHIRSRRPSHTPVDDHGFF